MLSYNFIEINRVMNDIKSTIYSSIFSSIRDEIKGANFSAAILGIYSSFMKSSIFAQN